ncbi:uncharacterized protein PV09_00946 [Verruconis gallopava]|uniref:Stress response protein ish1 n=1 Tax=Verruconis gallopava TaxID=253628 RepID=A0A0D2ANF0_9PEZI|nr:uncharacterized protein PV09_00946 [Verruconis gallopava]KIW08000.1 hypothetical protein PV09_00946 [Verruconis gallopava]
MRITFILAALTATATASTWFGKAAYNKWHETELERWLSDHNVPYPTPADRKDLENLIKDSWKNQVVEPYSSWDTKQLQAYLTLKGNQASKGAEKNKDKLLEQVKSTWTETEDSAASAYTSVKDWILDTWSESQLKAFLDKHGIPNPQPSTRDSLLAAARENFNAIAAKAGETASYPGDWLYSTWSESELKAWCDERGIPVPQPSSRDKLIASVRRNSRIASNNLAAFSSSISASAASATQSLSDALFDSWSDSQIKEWADKNGIPVPQGSKRNELLALARKHRAKLTGDNVSYKASSAFGAATSSAGNQFAHATSAAWDYVEWIRRQIGLGAAQASKSATSMTSAGYESLTSATDAAGKSIKSAASAAQKSASSASSIASKSASSVLSSISSEASKASSSASRAASAKGSKSAQKAGDAAAESVTKAKHRIIEQAQRATNYVKEEL